ncbi:hypothetical protein [Ferrovibrio sp.]|uniref:hypothetical protein n=1 Tax=Ferrovibrio sp. TaxID=1917215 RepID=UPI0025BBB584|nr:hypothetical protein [Ferrovibrio sp.]MBX3454837.1 hypothetical protein [Ferrovibrio sp.]
MALNAVQLCSRALVALAARPISAFDDGSVEAEVARHVYPATRDALLSAYPWRFATAQTDLARLVAPPRADFSHAFQLPPDFLRALSAGIAERGRGIGYRIVAGNLHANAEQITLTYILRPDEASFPAFFDQALCARLAAEFCLPLTESTSRAELLFKLSEDEFRRAKAVDAQQGEPGRIEDFTLVEARL